MNLKRVLQLDLTVSLSLRQLLSCKAHQRREVLARTLLFRFLFEIRRFYHSRSMIRVLMGSLLQPQISYGIIHFALIFTVPQN